MNQERMRRFSGGRLPAGVYNPVVTADGRRWRDYELAAEAPAPPPEAPEESRLTKLDHPGMKDRIRALLSGNGVPGVAHGVTGRSGIADADLPESRAAEVCADAEVARPDEPVVISAPPAAGQEPAAGCDSPADPAGTPAEDPPIGELDGVNDREAAEAADGALAGDTDAEDGAVAAQPGVVHLRATCVESVPELAGAGSGDDDGDARDGKEADAQREPGAQHEPEVQCDPETQRDDGSASALSAGVHPDQGAESSGSSFEEPASTEEFPPAGEIGANSTPNGTAIGSGQSAGQVARQGSANGGMNDAGPGRQGWAEIFTEGRRQRDWLDQPFRPPRLEETRPYGRPGGLDEPEPDAQVSLAQAVGTRFPDPRGTWIRLINAEGPTEDPFRSTNALDCSLAVISTWHGEPVVAARRYPEYDVLGRPLMTGESGGVARAEAWLGHRFEYVGHGRRAYVAIAQRLIFGGHGASAVLITRWPAGGSHAWNAVNSNGEVLWIDAQRGHMAVEPPYEEVTGVFSVVIDRYGQRL